MRSIIKFSKKTNEICIGERTKMIKWTLINGWREYTFGV